MNPVKINQLFAKLKAAIDVHPRLMRVTMDGKPLTASTPSAFVSDPTLALWRDSFTVKIEVKLRGSRKRNLSEINGSGDTPEEAVDDLINSLDIWATAIE